VGIPGTGPGLISRSLALALPAAALLVTLAGAALPEEGGGPPATPLVGSELEYTVVRGDSLTGVGARFGVDVTALAAANGLTVRSRIVPGQIVRVDGRHLAVPSLPEWGIVINLPQRFLFYAEDGQVALSFPVAVGKPDWKTPTGDFRIATRERHPVWVVPVSIQQEMRRLSGGEQQRVAIARAIVTDPPLLIADEPTGNLDAGSAEAILAVLQGLNRAGKTIVMVTHEPSIAQCAGRIIRMRDGRIVSDERRAPRPAVAAAPPAPAPGASSRDSAGRFESLPAAIQSLLRHRMRSLLTMLGVLIGVAGVIAMLALGAGTTESIEASVTSLGTNLIVLIPGMSTLSGARIRTGQSNLTPEDAAAIARECESVAQVSPIVATSGQAAAGETNWGTSIQGVAASWPAIRSWNTSEGAFFSETEVVRGSRVCVLGTTVAENLFPVGGATGKTVRIRNVPFNVLGVLERKGANLMGRDQDDLVVIPYTTVMRQLLGTPRISIVLISAREGREIAACEAEIAALLRQRHRTAAGADDFTLTSQQEVAAAAERTSNTLSFLLSAVATIALVVGGIGITNIMLVTVTERTREIGLRLAVGARPGQILAQFLAESLTLSLAGGALGVLLGVAAAFLISRIGGWSVRVHPAAVAIGFGSAAIVGVLAGLYPARRAARLEPVAALHSE
jgi:macrolide transport system ATP-binding/permease protein